MASSRHLFPQPPPQLSLTAPQPPQSSFSLSPRFDPRVFLSRPASRSYPLGGVVEHLLPGGVELPAVLLQQPLLGQGDGLLGRPQDLDRPLELLSGLLGFDLGLEDRREESVIRPRNTTCEGATGFPRLKIGFSERKKLTEGLNRSGVTLILHKFLAAVVLTCVSAASSVCLCVL